MASNLENVNRCTAKFNGGECKSAVFYDWGIQVLARSKSITPTGADSRFNGYTTSDNVKICTRCTTPYMVVEGELIDISDELSAEDVKSIIARGQASLPHPHIKDP